ncbi:DUF6276 family protein [Natronobeatus ordinarius]|uniref:DUF6276 family protein n=1 Tax=Natronobeatus ordinarius TaxID=2963433 RepID=UPI0020CBB864|nr:DUF6276 family protein [Natronobeatus ordinarius]
MACSACGGAVVDFSIPTDAREYAPGDTGAASICTTCLTVDSSENPDDPDFSRVSDAFPTNRSAAVPLALALGRCDSLVTNRAALETLLERVERAGADPLLIIDRLLADPSIEPAVDLERRRHQLEQLLY